jgi:hypothetical protein
MRNLLRIAIAVLVASTTALQPGAAGAATPAQAAQLCAGAGYKNFERADGSSFQNPGQCVQYAVQTGNLYEVVIASSVLSIIGGATGCEDPDANGDRSCIDEAGGCITGTFSTPDCPSDTSHFDYSNSYVLHPDGSVNGEGTAVCTGCVVAGRTGEVDLATTATGAPPDPDFPVLSSGTWRISSGTGGLVGIGGSGTWSVDFNTLNHTYTGKITLPI